MYANHYRFKVICVLVFVLYVYSVAVHEFVESTPKNGGFAASTANGYRTIKPNRSTVLKVDNKDYCRAPRVAIIISSRPKKYLRIYWDIELVREGDWISLFDEDPQQNGKEVVPIFAAKVENKTGIVETNITDVPINSSNLRYQSECFRFWAVYFTKGGSASAISCLKTHPTWMHDMRKYVGNVEIKRLFIPGTHDSGSYSSINGWSPLNFIERFIFTQDEDIFSQLIHGIRYLDLRISSNPRLMPESERWWINHGVARVQPLKNILEDVKKFLRQTREILILDFHGFPTGFDKDESLKAHKELVDYLKSELSEMIAPPNWNSTCNDLWSINKTLIVSYNQADTVKANPSFLWTPVSHKWPDAQNIDELKSYFTKIFASHPGHSWAAMAELTPTIWSIMTYQTNGLREMAEEVNPQVTSWFRGLWGKSSNIVAVDFFRGTDIVETAIEWNMRKIEKHICDIT